MSDAPNPLDAFDDKGMPVAEKPTGPANPLDAFDEKGQPVTQSLDQALTIAAGGPVTTPSGQVMAGPMWDTIAEKGPMSGILEAFGQSARDEWGSTIFGNTPLGPSPEFVESARKSGFFNDYAAGSTSLAKTFNEAFIRGGAAALEATYRTAAAIGAGLHGVAVEYAPPLAAGMEAFPTGLPGGVGALGAPGAFRAVIPASIAEARSLGVIGPGGESAWKGTSEQPPLNTEAMREALARLTPNREAIARQVSREPFGPPEYYGPPAELAGDVHAAARQIAPEVFAKYDPLAEQKDTFDEWLSDLAEQRDRGTSPEITALDRQIDTMREQALTLAPRARRPVTTQIAGLESQRAQLVRDLPETGDTPAMAMIRRDRMATDEQMRDLAPQVYEAYRQASTTGVPREPVPEATAPETPAAESPAGEAVAQEEPKPAQVAAAPAPTITGGISGDVARQLVGAGRPQEEAAVVGALQEARYGARAANLTGTTAEQLYAEEAPAIAAGRGASPRRLGRTIVGEDQTTIRLMAHADASTAIHELGHSYLEELGRDAADERATDGVRADAQTVRDWLGTDVSEPLPPRDHPDFSAAQKAQRVAHEKFARGFERYMMEGHAPTEALANVFSKFKDWLTNIYQTVARLRSPINADIRGVFDRMLTTPEREPVIAGEPTETFANLHENDALHTEPPEAASMARLVREERDRIGEAAAPEIEDERTGSRAAAENGRGAGGGAVAGEEGAGPQPAPGSPSGVSESGAISGGGGKAAEEGAGLPGERPGSTGGSGGSNAATAAADDRTNPAATLPSADRGLIDKAGNIRLDKLNTAEDVDNVIREMAGENGDFVSARRGVVSDQQVLDLAAAMGLRPEDLNVAKLREQFSPERVAATRDLFVQTASDVQRLSIIDNPTDADVMAYMTARSRLRMVQEYLSALTAETGRGLRAFRAVAGSMQEAKNVAALMGDLSEEKTFFQLRQEMQRVRQFDQAAKVSGYLRDVDKPGLGAMALELFKNWLISGPLTHLGYWIGNQTLAFWKAIPETAGQATIGAIQRAAGVAGAEASPRFGEVGAQLYAMIYGQKQGFKVAWDSLKAGQTMPLPGEAAAAATSGSPIVTPFTSRQAIPNFNIGGVPIPVGSIVRMPGERMIAPIHSYTRSLGYEQSIARQAYRTASAEGLDGQRFNARIADLTTNPSKEMMETARDDATEAALMGKGGALTQRASHLTNLTINIPLLGPTQPLGFINPFMKVASNIMSGSVLERGIGGGPIAALFPGRIQDDLLGRNGPVAQAETGGRLLAGTALTVVGGGLAMEGLITRSAPSAPRERSMWMLVHGMPHSLNIGGMSYDLSRLGILGFGLGIAADIQYAASRVGVDDAAKILSLVVHSFSQNFLDEGFMRGPSDLIKALDDPDRYGASYARNLFSSMAVPYSVGMGQIAHEIDPYMRQARTLADEMIAKVPWWSETLEPRIDVWGNPVLTRGWAVTYHQQLQDDPVNQTMLRLEYFPAPAERKIVGVALTDHQYTEYAIMAGRWAHEKVAHTIAMPSFALQSEGDQREALRHDVLSAHKQAADHMKMQYHTIWQAASEAKKAPLRGTKPPTGGWPQAQ